jgi:hypothetical protein
VVGCLSAASQVSVLFWPGLRQAGFTREPVPQAGFQSVAPEVIFKTVSNFHNGFKSVSNFKNSYQIQCLSKIYQTSLIILINSSCEKYKTKQ